MGSPERACVFGPVAPGHPVCSLPFGRWAERGFQAKKQDWDPGLHGILTKTHGFTLDCQEISWITLKLDFTRENLHFH